MTKGIIPIIIAVVLAALAAVLFWGIVESEKKRARAGWELTSVVVASANVAPGTILSEDLITTDKIPRKFRTADMVIPKELDTVLGNEVVFPIQKGDPLSWHHLRGRETAEDRLSKAVTKRAAPSLCRCRSAPRWGAWSGRRTTWMCWAPSGIPPPTA